MTQIFTPDRGVVPVTVVGIDSGLVLEVLEEKGVVKIDFGEVKPSRVNKPRQGYFKKLSLPPREHIREIKCHDLSGFEPGGEIGANIFAPGDFVDITGRTKGRGFAGMIKRWGASNFPKSHGHPEQRLPGSQGASATPSRVFKGKHLPGRMGGVKKTIQNLEVIEVRPDDNLLFIRGAIPGPNNGVILIRKALKRKPREKNAAPA